MADTQTPPQPDPSATPTGTPDNPIIVQIAGTVPGGPVFPVEGMDEALQEGGAYRFLGLDGSVEWKDAEGRTVKAPKGK